MTARRIHRFVHRSTLATALAGVLFTPLAALPAAASEEPEMGVQGWSNADIQRIEDAWIVTFKSSVSDKAIKKIRKATKKDGAEVAHTYSRAVRGFAATMSEAQVAELRKNDKVRAVEPDFSINAFGTQPSPPSYGLDRIDQLTLPLNGSYSYNTSGAGVTAYVIDTGLLSTHSDFTGRVSPGYTAISDGNGTTDCNGHGTHVAGTVGGTRYGVAKGVTIVPVRVLDCGGSGTTSGVIAGVDWVTNRHRSVGGPSVANMSLGGGISSTLDTAVANSIAAGVTYAVAAGNSNADACNSSPARVGAAITVGATTSSDVRASYSNYGSCLDIFAPGSSITSAWHTGTSASNTISGTSMASPHVAGVAATYLEANPTASPATVRNALVGIAGDAASSIGSGSPDKLLYGVLGTVTPTPPPPPPPAPEPGPVTPPPANLGPVASAPVVVVTPAGSQITKPGTAASVPATLSWSAVDADGIASYRVQHSKDGGTNWTTLTLPSPTATSMTVSLASTSHRFRMQATDSKGAVGAYATTPTYTLTRSDHTVASYQSSSQWVNSNHTDLYGGSRRQSLTANSTASYTFTGSQIAWIGTWSRTRGIATVSVDGGAPVTVDLYKSTDSARRAVFSAVLAPGTHTITIRVTGSKNSSSLGRYVDVDAFVTFG